VKGGGVSLNLFERVWGLCEWCVGRFYPHGGHKLRDRCRPKTAAGNVKTNGGAQPENNMQKTISRFQVAPFKLYEL